MTRNRKIVFALSAVGLSLVVSASGLLVVDIYVHHKFADSAGLNVWGYRGPVVGKKQNDERRIVVVGGSTAFGYGVQWDDALPAVLEGMLNQQEGPDVQNISVVNLAYNNEGSYSFKFTLQDYDYLDYDAVLFYSGYNNLSDFNPQVYRHDSSIFLLTGYYPMLPLVMREKAMVIRFGGELEKAYWGEKTTFKPNLAQRATASALDLAADISMALDRQLEREKPDERDIEGVGTVCGNFPQYCGEMYVAAEYILDRGKQVLIVTQPYISELHREQQRLMVSYLLQQIRESSQLHFVNLGLALDLKDPQLAYDGMHLTVAGNRQIAQRLVKPVQDLLR